MRRQATQKEIAPFLDVAHPTVVGLVSRMEQNVHVTCWPCEDGHNKYVKLTPIRTLLESKSPMDFSTEANIF